MADIITRLKFETDEFHNRARRATTEINNISQQLEKAGVRVDHMNAKNLKLAQSFGQMQTVSTTLRGKISELSEEFVAWSHHYNQITEEQRRSPYGKAIVQQLDVLKQRIRDTKGELAGIEGSLNGKVGGAGFGKQLLNGVVPGLGAGVGMAGVMVAAKAMQALKEQMVDTVRVNMDFEQSNANLSAILGKNIDEIGALTENAKMLGATTVYTAGQISELQTVLARRGFNQDQILNMTHGISNLAVATGTDLAESAELAASTMQAFGLKATDMERIVSVLGVSTTKSALTTQALGTSLQYVAPTARAAGFSLEDTVAMLGALVDSGLDASTAGTSLRQIILGMSTANGKLANSFGHPIRGLKDMTDSIHKMKEDGGASLDEISKKVRVTAVPAFLSLVENVDRLDALRDSITGVEDELQTMADKQINTLKGSTILLKSAWDGLKLSFSESNGIIKETVDLLTKLITKVTEARKKASGDDMAGASVYEKGVNKKAQEMLVNGMLAGGWTEDAIAEDAAKNMADYMKKREGLMQAYRDYRMGIDGDAPWQQKQQQRNALAMAIGGEGYSFNGKNERDEYLRALAALNDKINTQKYIGELAGKKVDDLTGTLVDDEVSGSTTGTVAIVERARDIVDKALLRYEQELKELQNRLRVGLIDQAEFDKSKVRLDENVWEAYGRADMLEPMQEWKDGMAKWEKTMMDDADVAGLSDTTKKLVQAKEKYTRALELASMEEEQGLQDSIAANRKQLSALEGYWRTVAELNTETKNADAGARAQELAAEIVVLRNTIKEQEEELKAKQIAHGIDNKTFNGLISVAKDATKGMDPAKFGGGTALDYFGLSGIKERLNADLMLDIPDKEWKELEKKINAQLEALGKPKIEIDVETGNIIKLHDEVKNMAGAWQYASQAIGSVSNALGSLENPTAKVAGIIAGAIAEMAAGLGAAIAQKGKELEPWSWIAFAAASTATFVSTAAAVKKATEYHADGGFVGGGPFVPRGTDTVPAMLTPGELVLTRSMQNNLAGQLAGSARGAQTIYVTGKLHGRDIRLAADADNRSRGGSRGVYARVK